MLGSTVAGEVGEGLEPSCVGGMKGKWSGPIGKFSSFFLKLKLQLAYNPTTSLLGIYPRENENLFSCRNLPMNVHSSFILNSPKWKLSDVLGWVDGSPNSGPSTASNTQQ